MWHKCIFPPLSKNTRILSILIPFCSNLLNRQREPRKRTNVARQRRKAESSTGVSPTLCLNELYSAVVVLLIILFSKLFFVRFLNNIHGLMSNYTDSPMTLATPRTPINRRGGGHGSQGSHGGHGGDFLANGGSVDASSELAFYNAGAVLTLDEIPVRGREDNVEQVNKKIKGIFIQEIIEYVF